MKNQDILSGKGLLNLSQYLIQLMLVLSFSSKDDLPYTISVNKSARPGIHCKATMFFSVLDEH